MNDAMNSAPYTEYKKLTDVELNMVFGGSLGEYKYYGMDMTIETALMIGEGIIGWKRTLMTLKE